MASDNIDNSSNDGSENDEFIPAEVMDEANDIQFNLVPDKSKRKYKKRYDEFKEWCNKKGVVNSIKEPVLLAYFNYLHVHMKYCSSTLWSIYSMLKSCFEAFDHQDISKYYALLAFIKKKHKGYKAKKAPTFTTLQVNKFCYEAPDDQFLLAKAVLAIGVSGMCRRIELSNLMMENVTHLENQILVTIPYTKTDVERSFKVIGQFYIIVMKYLQARVDIPCNKFFVSWRQGRFINVAAGKSAIAAVPKIVATFLKLPEPEKYTSHCIRRTSATVYVDNGATLTDLMRMGKWKSPSCAQGYIDDSLAIKEKAAEMITNAIMPQASTTISDLMSPIHSAAMHTFTNTASICKPNVTCTITRSIEQLPVNVQSSANVQLPMVSTVTKQGSNVSSNSMSSLPKILSQRTITTLFPHKTSASASTTSFVHTMNSKPKSSGPSIDCTDVPSELFSTDFESLPDLSNNLPIHKENSMVVPTVVVIPSDGTNMTLDNDSGFLDLLQNFSDESDFEKDHDESSNIPSNGNKQKESDTTADESKMSMGVLPSNAPNTIASTSNISQEEIGTTNNSNMISNLIKDPVASERAKDCRTTDTPKHSRVNSIDKWTKIPMFKPSNSMTSQMNGASWANESTSESEHSDCESSAPHVHRKRLNNSQTATTSNPNNQLLNEVNPETELKLGSAVLKFVHCNNITIHIHVDKDTTVQPK